MSDIAHHPLFPLAFRTVLELGSGVGLTGIALCRSCKPRKYVFSDCHPTVLQKLRMNVELNSQDLTDVSLCVEELDWEGVSEDSLTDINANTVIAAGRTESLFSPMKNNNHK